MKIRTVKRWYICTMHVLQLVMTPKLQAYKNYHLMTMPSDSQRTEWIFKTIKIFLRNASDNFAKVPRRFIDHSNHSYILLAARSMNPKQGNLSLVSFAARASWWAIQCNPTRWDVRSRNMTTTFWCTPVMHVVKKIVNYSVNTYFIFMEMF